jgi:hypothetical protein
MARALHRSHKSATGEDIVDSQCFQEQVTRPRQPRVGARGFPGLLQRPVTLR